MNPSLDIGIQQAQDLMNTLESLRLDEELDSFERIQIGHHYASTSVCMQLLTAIKERLTPPPPEAPV